MLRKVVLRAASVVAVGMMATSAVAGPSQRSWDGFSVSVGGGAAKLDNDLAVDTSNTDFLALPFFFYAAAEGDSHSTTSSDGWDGFGTLQAAYDHRVGNLVVGVLADFDFYPGSAGSSSTHDVGGTFGLGFGPFPPFLSFPFPGYAEVSSSIELKNVWSVGGRIGYVVSPDLLIYGLGGYTQARIDGQVDLSYFSLATGPETLTLRTPDKLQGYFLGAGGELQVAPSVALRLEYRYAKYDGETRSASASSGIPFLYAQTADIQASLDAEIQTVRGAIVLQLNQP